MIISASYKTDIPTFYGEWFMNRIRTGYCMMQNPYGKATKRIDLRPESVDGIVFWTKNIGPFLKHLPELRDRGYPFYIQHTITGYPREIEEKVIADLDILTYQAAQVAAEYGPDALIWRYDPILSTSLTRSDWHIRNFQRIARSLQGSTNECVISFAQTYKKTLRNVDVAAKEKGFEWTANEQVPLAKKQELAQHLAEIALGHGMQMKSCTQPEYSIEGLIEEAKCADLDRLERLAGHRLNQVEQKGMRHECKCFRNVDIGEYDTCPHGCIYCYATENRSTALSRYKAHDPEGEYLFPPTK